MAKREKTTTAIKKNLKSKIGMIAAERGVNFCVVLEDLIIKGLKDADNTTAA
jgi:phosphopantothenate synthetase